MTLPLRMLFKITIKLFDRSIDGFNIKGYLYGSSSFIKEKSLSHNHKYNIPNRFLTPVALATDSRTITSDRTVYNNSSLPFSTRQSITGEKLLRNKLILYYRVIPNFLLFIITLLYYLLYQINIILILILLYYII